MKKVLRNITFAYYAVYIAAIAAASAGYSILKSGIGIDPNSETGIAINSILIILIIGAVPVSLWYFNVLTKKWAKLESEELKLQKYQKAALIRLVVLGLALVLGVIFYYILGIQSMIFSAAIAAVGVFFCKPSEQKISTELELDQTPENE